MADAPTPFSTILGALTPDEQIALSRGTLEEVSHIIYQLAQRRPEMHIAPDAVIDQALDYFKAYTPEQSPSKEGEDRKKNPSLLDAAEGLASVAAIGASRTPQEDDIARNFAEIKKDQVKKDVAKLEEEMEGKSDEEKKAKLEEFVAKTKSSTIRDERVDDLAKRLGEKDGKTTRAAQRVRRRYTQWKNDNKKDTSDEAFGKYGKQLAGRLAGMSRKDREDFLMKMADHQISRTHNDFTDLFYEKRHLFGIGRLPTIRRRTISLGRQGSITRGQRKDLRPIREAQQRAENALTQGERRPRFTRIRLLINRFITQPEYSAEDWARNEYPQEYQSQQRQSGGGFNPYDAYNRFKQGRSFFNLIKGLGGAGEGGAAAGGAAGAGGGAAAGGTAAAAGTSEFWGPVLLAIVVGIIIIFLLVMLFVVLFNSSQEVSIQIEEETCGDFGEFIDATDFVDKFANLQQDYFHISDPGGNYKTNTDGSPNPHFQDAITAYKLLFNTYCLYYGHAQGRLEGLDNFNTFAKLLLGDRFVQQNGKWVYIDGVKHMGTGHEKAKRLNNFVAFEDKIPGCYAEFQNTEFEISTIFINLNKCSVQEAQFLIGQNLAHILIIQQADVLKNKGVYDLFKNGDLGVKPITTQDGFLPTYGCSPPDGNFVYGSIDGVVHKDPSLGELQADQQQRNCFADMVGEYLVYPYYLNTTRIVGNYSDTGVSPSPSSGPASPSPTPTPIPASGKGPEKLIDFPDGKFADYYNFARDNLFDGEIFIISLKAATCPDNLAQTGDVSALTDGLKKYGFNVTGNISRDKLSQSYQTVCLLMQSKRYKTLMKADQTPVTLNFAEGNCCGYTKGDTISIYGWHSPDFNRFTLAHELTHELVHDNRSPDIYQKYYNNVYIKSPTLPTFNCQHDYDSNYCTVDGDVCGTEKTGVCKYKCHGPYEGECIADGVGLYMTYPTFNDIFSGPDAGKGMADYPSGKYSAYYDFVYNEIFGATVFNGGNSTEGGDFASSVVDRFKSNPSCFHDSIGRGWAYLNKDDIGCIDTVSPPLPKTQSKDGQTAAGELDRSVSNYGILECVGFVRAVAAGIGKAFDVHGDARDYFPHPPSGYTPIPRQLGHFADIQAGDVVIYDYPGGQHIADVSKIISTYTRNNIQFVKFQVSEGNGGYCRTKSGDRAGGCIDRANDTTENGDIVGWIRPL